MSMNDGNKNELDNYLTFAADFVNISSDFSTSDVQNRRKFVEPIRFEI